MALQMAVTHTAIIGAETVKILRHAASVICVERAAIADPIAPPTTGALDFLLVDGEASSTSAVNFNHQLKRQTDQAMSG